MPEDVDKLVAAINVALAEEAPRTNFRATNLAAVKQSNLYGYFPVAVLLSPDEPFLECGGLAFMIGVQVGKALAEAKRLEAMMEAK